MRRGPLCLEFRVREVQVFHTVSHFRDAMTRLTTMQASLVPLDQKLRVMMGDQPVVAQEMRLFMDSRNRHVSDLRDETLSPKDLGSIRFHCDSLVLPPRIMASMIFTDDLVPLLVSHREKVTLQLYSSELLEPIGNEPSQVVLMNGGAFPFRSFDVTLGAT